MHRNKGLFGQTIILFERDCELFANNFKKILSTFGFPVLIGFLIILVSRENFFENYEGTKSALFTITSAGIYVGMFNSLTIVCKERKIVKREYMTNMSILAYILAQALLQAIICLIQSTIFMVIYWFSVEFPEEGLIFSGSFLEYLITLFLVMYAADLMGLTISCAVKKSEIANLVAPIIIIMQLVLSGVLFELEGASENIANLTVSKWGMEALGSISKLNDLPLKAQADYPMIPHEAEQIYDAVSDHLMTTWTVLIVFIVVLIAVSTLLLRRIDKDTR